MAGRIQDSLHPAFFISYSRRQAAFAAALRAQLSHDVKTVWFDQDRIQIGDVWRDEIEAGIRQCDELVLLVSDDSLASREVLGEVRLATSLGKIVRPFIIDRLHRSLPPDLSRFQHIDLSNAPPAPAIARIAAHLRAPDADGSCTDLKLLACRRLHPAFSERLIGRDGPVRVQPVCAELDRLAPGYPAGSTIWLNAGLAACLSGDWTRGLDRLRAHARAAGSFPAWYFLATHLLQRELVLGVPFRVVREALDAIERALAIARHPLALLTAAVLETGGANLGPARLEHRIAEFADALALREEPSEVMRLYWCLQPSFRVLDRFEPAIRRTLQELST